MKAERRQDSRTRLLRTGLLFGLSDLKCLECLILDISDGGATIEIRAEVEFRTSGRLICEPIGLDRAYNLVWREGPKAGVAFAK